MRWNVGLWLVRFLIVGILAFLVTEIAYILALVKAIEPLDAAGGYRSALFSSEMQQVIVVYGSSALALAASVLVASRARRFILATQVLLYGGIIWAGLAIAQRIPLAGVSILYLSMLATGGLLVVYWLILYRREVSKRS